ncbi:MAG: hypothetical protein A2Z91_06930 [Deltaproteobacteria bacterium GWA2_38_16]|nr:MAG: hypothetical protein A2Z91_06930 [Deltaproteobacteria bacterium GWA2_38_16]OGQ02395.1 MAG: hypothetical protein A3D19_06095 [Deltaproteobacteria bacterium RIFCSPHIGHO2_02_FULL_38_15]OGQ29967.1 MAG: hypothetical protein A3A72_06015 [Deltaproteobacteria bacterium RIFCSPLOWO2_01_FULL_38_9]OGQ62154.1 MAG: hypothetical protein A3G92_06380 [Deltaproteobacteria bacterium RIFCSPLOWO2_12_FULL_38_8]HBQ20730.1 hypothetical protein [Deltaproteobacteria bacterium]
MATIEELEKKVKYYEEKLVYMQQNMIQTIETLQERIDASTKSYQEMSLTSRQHLFYALKKNKFALSLFFFFQRNRYLSKTVMPIYVRVVDRLNLQYKPM